MDATSGFDFLCSVSASNCDNYIRVVHIAQEISLLCKFKVGCRLVASVRKTGHLDGYAYRMASLNLKREARRSCRSPPTSAETVTSLR